jgi:hypothetical protein
VQPFFSRSLVFMRMLIHGHGLQGDVTRPGTHSHRMATDSMGFAALTGNLPFDRHGQGKSDVKRCAKKHDQKLPFLRCNFDLHCPGLLDMQIEVDLSFFQESTLAFLCAVSLLGLCLLAGRSCKLCCKPCCTAE